VLVTLLDIKTSEELEAIKKLDNFASDYILIDSSEHIKKNKDLKCCDKDICLCHIFVYLIRPYTFEILRALQPFFELIAYSKMPLFVLEAIINHIEKVLNKPI
jgi:hypothetical protein